MASCIYTFVKGSGLLTWDFSGNISKPACGQLRLDRQVAIWAGAFGILAWKGINAPWANLKIADA